MSEINLPQDVEGQPTGGTAAAVEDDCACTLWAVVDANGNLVRDLGANVSSRLNVGVYEVRFNRDVTGCAYVATIGLPGQGNPPPGEISVASSPNPNGVRVDTANNAGAPADRPFHLAVHCGSDAGD
jgi:hypothetical protein